MSALSAAEEVTGPTSVAAAVAASEVVAEIVVKETSNQMHVEGKI